MSLLSRHFWKFFFGLVALVSSGILIIYIASLFDGRESASQKAESTGVFGR